MAISSRPNKVRELIKSIYGLKEACRKTYEKLTTFQHNITKPRLNLALVIHIIDSILV